MQIMVRNLTGKTVIFEFEPLDTIERVKAKIERREGVSSQHQRLIYAGVELQNGKTLSDYNIRREAIVYLILRSKAGLLTFVSS